MVRRGLPEMMFEQNLSAGKDLEKRDPDGGKSKCRSVEAEAAWHA